MTTLNHEPADIVRDFNEEMALPGLESYTSRTEFLDPTLQTPAYARGALDHIAYLESWSEDQIDEAVKLRMERAQQLLGNSAVTKIILLDESILDREIGSPRVMEEALEYTWDMFNNQSRYPNTSFLLIPNRIIPGTAHLRGSLGDCALTQSREHGTNVWTADATLAAPKDSVVTQNAPQTFEHNRRAAVPLSRALNIIKRRQEQWAREL